MTFDVYRLSGAELKLLKDWKQFSEDCCDTFWATPDEDLMSSFSDFLEDREYKLSTDELYESMEGEDSPQYLEDLKKIRELI